MHGNDCCGSIEYNIDTSRNSNQCNPLEESMTERLESSFPLSIVVLTYYTYLINKGENNQ